MSEEVKVDDYLIEKNVPIQKSFRSRPRRTKNGSSVRLREIILTAASSHSLVCSPLRMLTVLQRKRPKRGKPSDQSP